MPSSTASRILRAVGRKPAALSAPTTRLCLPRKPRVIAICREQEKEQRAAVDALLVGVDPTSVEAIEILVDQVEEYRAALAALISSFMRLTNCATLCGTANATSTESHRGCAKS